MTSRRETPEVRHDMASDRAAFRAAALEWAKIIRVPWGQQSANAAMYRLRDLSGHWHGAGQLRPFLEPLLAESEPLPVRVLAATHLYRAGDREVAPLLRTLAQVDDVTAQPARAALGQSP